MHFTIALSSHPTASEEIRSYVLGVNCIQVQKGRGDSALVWPHREEEAGRHDTVEKEHDFKCNLHLNFYLK